MPSAQCKGSHAEAVAGSSEPGKTSASSTAAAPRPASAQRASSLGNICCSTAYTVSTSHAVTESAGAKPKRGGSLRSPHARTIACRNHPSSRAMRAARSDRRAAPAAGTA